MKYKRKTRHDYENFSIEVQEGYLNLRHQYGYHYAGRWLNSNIAASDLIPLIFSLAIMNTTIGIVSESLRKEGLL